MIYITRFNNLVFNKTLPDVAILEGPSMCLEVQCSPELSLEIITIGRDLEYAPLVIQEYKHKTVQVIIRL